MSSLPLAAPGEKTIGDVFSQSRDLAYTIWGMSTRRMRALGAMVLFL